VWSARPTGRPEFIAAAAVMVLAGVVASTPWLVGGLSVAARGLPLPVRLALRHAGRHRFRTGAAVAVVTVAIAGSVALGAVNGAKTVNAMVVLSPGSGQPVEVPVPPYGRARTGQVMLDRAAADLLPAGDLARVAAALPTRQVVDLRFGANNAQAYQPFDEARPGATISQFRVAVGGPELVRLVAGRDPTPAERAVLDRGGAIAFHSTLVTGATVRLLLGDNEQRTVDAVVVPVDRDYAALPGVVITPATAQRLGLATEPGPIVFDTTRPPSDTELAAANAMVLRPQAHAAAGTVGTPVALDVAAPPPRPNGPRTETIFYVLAVLSAAVSLLAAAAAVSLATSESRDDLSTMVAVGVTPRLRRLMTAAHAAVIVGLGALLGLAIGIVPAAGLIGYSTSLEWRTPWLSLAAVVVAVPLAATLLAGLLTRTRPVLTRRLS
jgi:putative ABC transport system permease protein